MIPTLHLLVLIAAAGVATLWANSIYELHRLHRISLTQVHHEYWGALLLLAPASWRVLAVACWLVGLWIMIDDAVQHETQVGRPYYLSPLHRWYVRAYRWLHARGMR